LNGAFKLRKINGRGKVGIVPQEGAVRSVGIKRDEGKVLIDTTLGHKARDNGLAYAPFFAANKVNGAHAAGTLAEFVFPVG